MSDGERQRPIVVKRKRTSSEPAHGAWKIAYADFMTAMMAFFMVMWLIAGLSQAQLKQVSDYFRTPLKVALVGGDKSTASDSAIPGGGDDPIHSSGEMALTAPQAKNYASDAHRLTRLQRRLESAIHRDPALNDMLSQIQIEIVPDGLRIEIFDSQRRPMFALGSAKIAPYVAKLLGAIAPRLNSVPNKIKLTGHTDDVRFASGGRRYGNWELSTDRANAARRTLIGSGMRANKVLRVVGAAATHSVAGDTPDAAVNRRIAILVLSDAAQARIENEGRAGKKRRRSTAGSQPGPAARASQSAATRPSPPPAAGRYDLSNSLVAYAQGLPVDSARVSFARALTTR